MLFNMAILRRYVDGPLIGCGIVLTLVAGQRVLPGGLLVIGQGEHVSFSLNRRARELTL